MVSLGFVHCITTERVFTVRFSETPGSPSRYQSLEAGLQLLYRTIGAYSHSKLGPLGDHLPEDWGPAAWLAWMCSQVNGKLPQATWLGKVSVLKKGEVDSQGNTGEWAEEPESPAASNFEPEKLQEGERVKLVLHLVLRLKANVKKD